MNHSVIVIKIPKNLFAASAVAALLCIIAWQLGLFRGGKLQPGLSAASGQALPAGARTLKLTSQSLANTLAWQGVVKSRQAVKISAKYPARILEMPARVGDRVKQGGVLARLDNREPRAAHAAAAAALTAAQAQARQAEQDLKRVTQLYEKQAATRQTYDAAVAQAQTTAALLKQAAGRAEQTQAQLAEDAILAPFDGVVGERWLNPGDMAQPGLALLSFHQPGDLRLEAGIAEQCQTALHAGQTVEVQIDALNQTLKGKIEEIAPEIDPQTRSRLLKVALPPAPGLAHGQFGRLELACEDRQTALLIPASAVMHYGQLQAVRVVEGEYTHIQHIRTGKSYGAQLEVLSGLRPGETIMTDLEAAP